MNVKKRVELIFALSGVFVFYVLLTLLTLLRASDSDFLPTIVKSLEDPELYLLFFNQTLLGKSLYPLHQWLGFYYADFLVLSYFIIFSLIAAAAFYLIAERKIPLRGSNKWVLAAITIGFVVLSRKFYELARLLPTIESLRALYQPQSSWMTRFFQPGFALCGFLFFLYAIENRKFLLTRLKRTQALVLIFLSAMMMPTYPWFSLVALSYTVMEFFSDVFSRKIKFESTYLIFAFFVQTLFLAGKMGGIHPDLVSRVGATFSHWPEPNVFFTILKVAAIAWLLRKQPLAKTVLKLQLAAAIAMFSSVRGYTIEPDHFMLIHIVTIPLLILSFYVWLTSGKKTSQISKSLAIVIGLMFVLIGVREQLIFKYPGFFKVPLKKVKTVARTQKECGVDSKPSYFFSKDAYLNWTLPARTNCKNILFLGRGDWGISNIEIARRYMAAMIAFGNYSSKAEFLKDLDIQLKHLGSSTHEQTRDLTQYSDQDRFYDHMLWYGFLGGYYEPSHASYLRDLFERIDPSEEIRFLKRLDQKNRILKL